MRTTSGAASLNVAIEAGRILTDADREAEAADLYHAYLVRHRGEADSMDEGYVYVELCRLLMKLGLVDDEERLELALTGLAKCLGVGQIEGYVNVLSDLGPSKIALLKRVYTAAASGSADHNDLAAFFKGRGW